MRSRVHLGYSEEAGQAAETNHSCCLLAEISNDVARSLVVAGVAPAVDTTTMTNTTGAPRAVEGTTLTTRTGRGAGATTVGG